MPDLKGASPRYGTSQVRKSLGHFATGKLVGALIGVLWLLGLVRALAPADYGAYFTLYAYVEILILISAVGVVQVQERFVPELRSKHHDRAVANLAGRLLLLRLGGLLVSAGLAVSFSHIIASWISLESYQREFILVQGILVCEGLSRMVESYHDALLAQGRSQMSVILRNLLRITALGVMVAGYGSVSLRSWIEVELLVSMVGAAFGLALFLQTQRRLRRDDADAAGQLAPRRLFDYGALVYLSQLCWLPASTDMLRILANRFFGVETAALLAICLAITQLVQRYLPTYLLMGMVRPLFIVAAQESDAPKRLDVLLQMFVKLNLLLLIPMLALSVLFEPILLRLVSGQEALVAGGLLPLLTLVLILQAIKTCTAMAVAALEDGRTQLTTSLVNAVIFGVGVWAAGRQRLELLIGALLVGELVSFCVMSMSLRRNGVSAWKFTPSALMLAAPLAVICVLTVSLTAVSAIQRVWVLGSYIGLGAAVVLLLLRRSYFDEAEVAWFAGLLPDRLRRRFKGLH